MREIFFTPQKGEQHFHFSPRHRRTVLRFFRRRTAAAANRQKKFREAKAMTATITAQVHSAKAKTAQ